MADAAELIIRIRDDGHPAGRPAGPAPDPRTPQPQPDRLFEPERPREPYRPAGRAPERPPEPVAPVRSRAESQPAGRPPEPLRAGERRNPDLDAAFDPQPAGPRPAQADPLASVLREFDPEAAGDVAAVFRAFGEARKEIAKAGGRLPVPGGTYGFAPGPADDRVQGTARTAGPAPIDDATLLRVLAAARKANPTLYGALDPQPRGPATYGMKAGEDTYGLAREPAGKPPPHPMLPPEPRPAAEPIGLAPEEPKGFALAGDRPEPIPFAKPAAMPEGYGLADAGPNPRDLPGATYQLAQGPERAGARRFRYEGLDHDGNDVRGTVRAADEAEARRKVIERKRFVTKMTAVPRAEPVGKPPEQPIPLASDLTNAGTPENPGRYGVEGMPRAKPVPPSVAAAPLDDREQAVARERARLEGRAIPRAMPVNVDTKVAAERNVSVRDAEKAEAKAKAEREFNAKLMLAQLHPSVRAGIGAMGGKAGLLGEVAGAGESGLAGAKAAVGGPVGLAMVAAEAAAKGFQTVGKAAEAVGTGMSQLADNDHMGVLRTATGAAAGVLEAVPVVGKPFAEALKAGTAAVGAYSEAVNSFVQRGRELSQYNSQLAGATATADVRAIYADLREASKLAPSLSRLIDAQSRATTAIRDALLPLRQAIITAMTKPLENLANWLERNETATRVGGDVAIAMGEQAVKTGLQIARQSGFLGQAVGLLSDMTGLMKDDKQRQVIDEMKEINDRINGIGSGMPMMPPPVDHAAGAMTQQLGAPILGLN